MKRADLQLEKKSGTYSGEKSGPAAGERATPIAGKVNGRRLKMKMTKSSSSQQKRSEESTVSSPTYTVAGLPTR